MEQKPKRFYSLKTRFFTSLVLFPTILALSLNKTIWLTSILLLGIIISIFEMPKLYKTYWFIKILLYPGIPTFLLLGYTHCSSSWLHMMQPFIFAWTADVAGYFAGNLLGKYPLCPRISPGKTIEGSLASLLATSLIASSLFWGVLLGIAAIAGDLFVSWLKRNAHVKDTGTLLPGHGGLLDRLDSVYGVICILNFI